MSIVKTFSGTLPDEAVVYLFKNHIMTYKKQIFAPPPTATFERRPNRYLRRFSKRLSNRLIPILFFLSTAALWSQSECPDVLNLSDCISPVQNPNQAFTCIDATQNQNITYWISTGKMLPYASSQSAPQFLIIKGFLRILPDALGITSQYTFAQGSEIIFADNYSGLEVAEGATLTLQHAYAHGCEEMWNYMRAEQGGCIKAVDNTTIADGRFALWAWAPNARIQATNCVFQRNYTSIAFGNPFFINGFPVAADMLYGNTFMGDENLLTNPWGSTQPFIGVGIENISTPIKIGQSSGQSSANRNHFVNFEHNTARCVNIRNSSVTVENSEFTRSSLPGDQTGILFGSTTGAHILMIRGVNDDLTSQTFSNFQRAIGITNGNLDVSDISCYGNRTDIVQLPGSFDFPATGPVNCKITKSRFEKYDKSSIVLSGYQFMSNGITYSYPLLFQNLEIRDNLFWDNRLNNPNQERFAVNISSYPDGSGIDNGYIGFNEIRNLPKGAPLGFTKGGIGITNVDKLVLERNRIQDEELAFAPGSFFKGIQLNACAGSKLLSNDILGNTTTLTQLDMVAIENRDSYGTTFDCNSVDMTNYGIRFAGPGSNNHTLKHNNFHHHLFGAIYLQKDANIGVQSKGENLWLGKDGNDEAFMEWNDTSSVGPYYDPTDPAHQDFVFNTRGGFSINSPGINDPNDLYWAYPRKVDNIEDLGVWFRPDYGEPVSVVQCKHTPDPESGPGPGFGIPLLPTDSTPKLLTPNEERIIAGTTFPYLGEGWAWEQQFQAYGRLRELAELRQPGTDAADWYEEQNSTPFGQLSGIYYDLRNLLSVRETEYQSLQPAYHALKNLVEESGNIATAIYQSGSETEISALNAQREANAEATAEQTQAYASLLADFHADLQQQASTLLSNLNAVTATQICDINLQSVLNVQLNCLLSESAPDESQTEILRNIAGQCRYDGGWAVALARLMLPDMSWNEEQACSATERNMPHNLQRNGSISISPNPARDFMDVQISGAFKVAVARVFNMQGDFVTEWRISENTDRLQPLHLAPGVYMTAIVIDGVQQPTQKLVIIP